MGHPVLNALKKASRGVLLVSEIDSPYRPFLWEIEGSLTKKKLLEKADLPEKAKVDEIDFETFMASYGSEQKWHGAEEKAMALRYQDLAKTLREHLSHLKVFKAGDSKLKVFVIGKTEDGQWAGLEAIALET